MRKGLRHVRPAARVKRIEAPYLQKSDAGQEV
jgi:hypothetical protein